MRNGVEESAEFEQQQHNQAAAKKRIPVIEALLRHPGAFLKIIALRLCELLTMYIVTALHLIIQPRIWGYRANFSLILVCW